MDQSARKSVSALTLEGGFSSSGDANLTTRAIGDRWRLARLITAHGLRRLGRALSAPFRIVSAGVGGSTPDRLTIAIQDLRTTDPTVASDIYAGYFVFAGKVVTPAGQSPFQAVAPSDAWSEALMGFGWLRHLRAADSALARVNARALVDDWIGYCGTPHPCVAWRPPVVARRLISWLSQSPLILEGADRGFYKRFLRSISRQANWLSRALGSGEAAEDRLVAAIALASVAICTGASSAASKRSLRLLAEELDYQILPDGGHVGRNPQTLIDLLTDLLPLRKAYARQGLEPPRAVMSALDRMMPALRLFRHGDGSLALFNGMGATSHDRMATLLAYTDARSTPIENAPHSGYQRLQARGTLVIMDAGATPPQAYSGRAHAGCLSFELSEGMNRIVVNCGAPPPGGDPWRQAARSTAAHSTLTIADTSSCRFVAADGIGAMLGTPVLAGPEHVDVHRESVRAPDQPAIGVRASHDGYVAEFGIVHERRLMLEQNGNVLRGEDWLKVTHAGRARDATDAYAIRFHLHPSVKVSRTSDGLGVLILPPSGRGWTFSAGGLPINVEESIFFGAPDGARRCEQIVVSAAYRNTPNVSWSFERVREEAQRTPVVQEPEFF